MKIEQCKQINIRARVDILVLSYYVNTSDARKVVSNFYVDEMLEFAGDKLMTMKG